MFWSAILLSLLIFIIIYFMIPGGRLWNQYLEDIKNSMTELNTGDNCQTMFTEDMISELPDLIQKHILNGGYIGKPLMDHMMIHFHNTKFRMSPGKNPINIKFMQINFTKRPDRNAFLTGRILGIPLQAKDSILNGYGSMTGMLAKRFQLFCSAGKKMDQSQLITALADAVYMPSLFLKEYVLWTVIDEHTLEGKISWKGISAKGRFTFDQNGNIRSFYTNDRYMDENGKGSSLVPWSVTYLNYKRQNGYFQPGSIKVNWILQDVEYTYFESNNIEIKYKIEELEVVKP